MRRFHLVRSEDETGKSGIGVVAEGCVFTDGSVAIRWMSTTPSWILYRSLEHLERIHSHDGKTTIVWKDE